VLSLFFNHLRGKGFEALEAPLEAVWRSRRRAVPRVGSPDLTVRNAGFVIASREVQRRDRKENAPAGGAPLALGGPTKILFVVGSLEIGGAERQIVQMCTHLDLERYAPAVATLGPPGPLAQPLQRRGIQVFPLKFSAGNAGRSALRRAISAVSATRRLRALLRRINPQIVHAYLLESGVVAAAACLGRNARLVFAKRSLVESIAQSTFFAPLVRFANSRADLIHVNSKAVADDVVEKEGVAREKIRLTYNGVETSRFCPAADRSWGPAVRVGMMANFIPYKGHEDAIDAFALLAQRFPSLELWLWGRPGPIVPALEATALRGGFRERVRFLGVTDEPAGAYRQMDIFVSASHEEGFSNSILEAMASGLPIVATAVGGSAEQIEDGKSGLLVPARQPAALAAALATLLDDPDLAARLGTGARSRVTEHFSLEATVASTSRLYDELVTANGAS
jgi:glycosyltransferase involved in cell wall biosynthesis